MAGTNNKPNTESTEAENPQRKDEVANDIAQAEREAEDNQKAGEDGATETQDAKTDVVSTLKGHDVGDHYAQKFANSPENPKLAPGLDPDLPQDQRVKLVLSDSDHPDPANPKVTYVHKEMVGDYLRAGWRHPDA